MSNLPAVAYFSMEICLEEAIPTYSGGLGVLAGDTLRSAADLQLPMVAVTLLYRKGYFRQELDAGGRQREHPVAWRPEARLEPVDLRVSVTVEDRTVLVRPWLYRVRGVSGHEVPVYLLDTALPENDSFARTLTDSLYGGDMRYRLAQEMVLGLGGVEVLRALHPADEHVFHLNEGHSALLTLALAEQRLGDRPAFDATGEDLEAVRQRCVFTTHTPVPAGHDRFPASLVVQMLGPERAGLLQSIGGLNGELNMTKLALRLARYVNGVAMRHREVSRAMFPEVPIDAVTNGVHAVTWTSEPFRELFDRHMPEWRRDNLYLRYATGIEGDEIQHAHSLAKRAMCDEVESRTGVRLDPATFTIGFARRATPYKQADLVFTDPDRLRAIARRRGPVQIVFGGKAHPADGDGKALIQRIFAAAAELGDDVRVVYLENYEMSLGRALTAGVDLWLNNPQRPLEASGTSGMKAALNGVPSLSVLDGWWIEGHVEGVTGWSIGQRGEHLPDRDRDVHDLYTKLEELILPLYYAEPAGFVDVMRSAIALNGSFFNTQRMVMQYLQNAYLPGVPATAVSATEADESTLGTAA